jgi:DNA-binding NarL/FixJ family response regulator
MTTLRSSAAPRVTNGARTVRVALVNDFELVLRGIEGMLEPYAKRIEVVEHDVRGNPKSRIDVALYDTYGQPHASADRVRSLIEDPLVGAVAVYAWRLTPAQVEAVMAAGARGVLDKTMRASELADALVAIAAGETVVSPEFRNPAGAHWPGQAFGLTVRESEVASLLLQGLSNRAIAETLSISEHTVKTHLKGIFHKVGVSSRGQAVARIAGEDDFRRRAVR